MVLYKYRSDSKNTENIFTNKQVCLAKPDTLNDPLECSYNIPLDLIKAHSEMACKAQIFGFAVSCAKLASKGRTPFGIPQNEIDEFWRSLKPVFTIKEDYWLFREFQMKHGVPISDKEGTFYQWKKAVKEVGIFSLNSEIDNQPKGDYFEPETTKLYEDCTSGNGNIKARLFETAFEAEPLAFYELYRHHNRYFYAESRFSTFHGYLVLAADGSGINIPTTKETLEEFGTSSRKGTLWKTKT